MVIRYGDVIGMQSLKQVGTTNELVRCGTREGKEMYVYFTLLNDPFMNDRDFIRDGNLQFFIRCRIPFCFQLFNFCLQHRNLFNRSCHIRYVLFFCISCVNNSHFSFVRWCVCLFDCLFCCLFVGVFPGERIPWGGFTLLSFQSCARPIFQVREYSHYSATNLLALVGSADLAAHVL